MLFKFVFLGDGNPLTHEIYFPSIDCTNGYINLNKINTHFPSYNLRFLEGHETYGIFALCC